MAAKTHNCSADCHWVSSPRPRHTHTVISTQPYRREEYQQAFFDLILVLAISTMKVVSTFHHPSAVSCSAKCNFIPNNREYLVVGKTNRLELYSLQPKGLHLEYTLDVWGHIVTIRPVEFSVSPFRRVSG